MLSSVMVACNNNSKVVYIDVNLLYESFEYKKELSAEYNKVKSVRDRVKDSLENELSQLSYEFEGMKSIPEDKKKIFDSKREYFLQVNQQFDEDNENLRLTYDSKIIKQLNSYIKEFGDKNSYDLILGADNKGTVLYGKKDLDKTKDLLEYVNNRYKGEKK
ncbi:MAG TPA: OmpH family outer membrane protein [Bacteroidia bacterium]